MVQSQCQVNGLVRVADWFHVDFGFGLCQFVGQLNSICFEIWYTLVTNYFSFLFTGKLENIEFHTLLEW